MSAMQPKWFRRLDLAVGHVVWAVENEVVRGGKVLTIDNDGRYDVMADEGSTLRGVAREKLCLRCNQEQAQSLQPRLQVKEAERRTTTMMVGKRSLLAAVRWAGRAMSRVLKR